MREPVIGYAFGVTNRPLGLEFFGTPKELLDELGSRGLDASLVIGHAATELETAEVFKSSPDFSFSGSSIAETVLELVDRTRGADLEGASEVLRHHPGVLASDQEAAAVPLLAAVAHDSMKMVQLLLRSGARVDAAGQFAMRPLHWAAVLGTTDVMALLLDAGADTQRITWFCVTAGDLAAINGHDAVLRLLAERQGSESHLFSLDLVVERMTEGSIDLG
jgi:hypothetical protein